MGTPQPDTLGQGLERVLRRVFMLLYSLTRPHVALPWWNSVCYDCVTRFDVVEPSHFRLRINHIAVDTANDSSIPQLSFAVSTAVWFIRSRK